MIGESAMKKSTQVHAALAAAALFLGLGAGAQNAPGEDPVVLVKRVAVQMLPTGAARVSTPLESVTDMPSWVKAKVVRYEARSNSDIAAGFLSDGDVTRSATSDGFRKTCIQEVGSSSTPPAQGAGRNGVPANQQIVVLRGDLVNICK
jgi:hypothetical protein